MGFEPSSGTKLLYMKAGLFVILIWIAAIIGEVRCIYQFCTSDFQPSYKRECIYGISMITGIGAVTGYMNFPDEPAVAPATK